MTAKSQKLAVFRCAASAVIGFGHLRRCKALAERLSRVGWVCEFATDGESAVDLSQRWPDGVTLLVTDGYDIDATFESACRPWAETIVVIDDLADRPHDADILIDHNVGRRAEDYAVLVPSGCRIFAGPGFAVLATDFSERRQSLVPRTARASSEPSIIVSLGGGDTALQRQLLDTVLEGLALIGDPVEVVAIVPTEQQAADVVARGFRARTGIDAAEMTDLIANADLAVGAGGVSLLERSVLGLPSLVTTVADNQRPGTEAAAAMNACQDLGPAVGVTSRAVADAAGTLLSDRAAWMQASGAAARVTDGFGTARIVAALTAGATDRDGAPVALRRAGIEDTELLLSWQRNPDTRAFARNTNVPTSKEHTAWMDRQLSCGTSIFNVVIRDDEPVGVMRLDKISGDRSGYEVSILTDPGLHGRGLAAAALEQAPYLADGQPIWAWIAGENTASHALFRRAGYKPAEGGWYVAVEESVAA